MLIFYRARSVIGYSAVGGQRDLLQFHGKDRPHAALGRVKGSCKRDDPGVRTKRHHKLYPK